MVIPTVINIMKNMNLFQEFTYNFNDDPDCSFW